MFPTVKPCYVPPPPHPPPPQPKALKSVQSQSLPKARVQTYVKADPPKKMSKPKLRWHPQSVLLNVSIPQPNPDVKKRNKKYKIVIRFKSGLTGRIQRKTIWFGDPKGQYVDDHDQSKRLMRHDRLNHQNDPFHANYWRLHLLNSEPTLQQAYVNFVASILEYRKVN